MINRATKRLLEGLALLSMAGLVDAAVKQSQNLGLFRSSSANSARELMMAGSGCQADSDGFSASVSVAGFYDRYKEQTAGKGLGAMPFWSGTNVMAVKSGLSADAAVPTGTQLNAGQMLLGTGVDGTMTLTPVAYKAGADLAFSVACSANEPGFFGKVSAPVGVMSIDPALTSTVSAAGDDYTRGMFNLLTTDLASPYTSLVEAMAGGKTAGTFYTGLAKGKINGKQTSGAKVGDINLSLGYNFVCDEDKCLGVALRAAAPTGNKATGEYMLEPIFGRSGNWGLGGELSGSMQVWEGSSSDKSLRLNLQANALHLFKATSARSFDLTANGNGSKYLLVADYNNNVFGGAQTSIQNLVNLSTLDAESSFGIEADASVALDYVSNGWNLAVGYNIWGRSAEKLAITGTFDETRYAILGNQGSTQTGATTAVTLCQPTAKMDSMAARADAAAGLVLDATVAANRIAGVASLNVAGAQQDSSFSSKAFGKAGYSWMDSDYCPHLAVMGSFEFSHSDNNALAQWGVGVEGGVSF